MANIMRLPRIFVAALVALLAANDVLAEIRSISIVGADRVATANLDGPDSAWRIVVSGTSDDGDVFDVTPNARFRADPAGIIRVNESGIVTPVADGTASVVASVGELETTFQFTVRHVNKPRKLNFVTDVAPLFTRFGCNSGGCHGKKGGQEGFELALLGFEPQLDYDRLVKEGDGYRIDLESPAESYLLQKAIKAEPHAGGKRFDKDSAAYRRLLRWIEQGASIDGDDASVVRRIEVLPTRSTIKIGGRQQLTVLAHMSDGSIRDVGQFAQFESNQPGVVTVDHDGLVSAEDTAGVAGVMIRYQAHVDVFHASVPTGRQVGEFPKPLNLADEHVFAQLKRLGIPASNTCDDATFIRRATLDIAGRLPTVEELESFTGSTAGAKFARLIDRLLESDDHASYFAGKWAAMLRNRRNTDRDSKAPTEAFYNWIRDGIRENRPYDEFVRDVLTASGEEGKVPPVVWYRSASDPSAQLEDVAQLFLGQRIQCARCHHHPFEKWSQDDYYGMAAFFSRLEVEDRPKQKKQKTKPPVKVSFKPGRAEAKHPRTGKPILPTPLESDSVQIDEKSDPRESLAEWMTRADNRFMPRVLANRYWKHFLGRGLVEPEDDLRVTNPASNPDLLDALAAHFVKSKFDSRALIRTICLSRTYRLSSAAKSGNIQDTQNYSRFLPRRLKAEILLDAIDVVTKTKTRFSGQGDKVRAIELPDNINGSHFLSAFGRPAGLSVCECERASAATLAQQLHMLNSPEIIEKVRGNRAGELSTDKRPHEQRIRDLYLVAIAREPLPAELAALQNYIDAKLGTSAKSPSNAEAPEPKAKPIRAAKSAIVQVTTITSSAKTSGDVSAKRAFDNDSKTRWSIRGKGHWIQVELSSAKSFTEIRAGFTKGERKYSFDLQFSNDGKSWTKAQRFESAGKGDGLQTFKFPSQTAKFVRMTHQGNSTGNDWANLHTLELPGIEAASDSIAVETVDRPIQSLSPQPASKIDEARKAYADIIWALINTKEFQFNH